MGKIKGWIKLLSRIDENGPPYMNTWVHDEQGKLLTIKKLKNGYSVSTSSFVEKFKSYDKARKFATRYMKNHPNG